MVAANDRGYGHLAVCGLQSVVKYKWECGVQTLLIAQMQPYKNTRVLCACLSFLIILIFK